MIDTITQDNLHLLFSFMIRHMADILSEERGIVNVQAKAPLLFQCGVQINPNRHRRFCLEMLRFID